MTPEDDGPAVHNGSPALTLDQFGANIAQVHQTLDDQSLRLVTGPHPSTLPEAMLVGLKGAGLPLTEDQLRDALILADNHPGRAGSVLDGPAGQSLAIALSTTLSEATKSVVRIAIHTHELTVSAPSEGGQPEIEMRHHFRRAASPPGKGTEYDLDLLVVGEGNWFVLQG